MIGSLRGVVLDRSLKAEHHAELLVEVGGVGYRVSVPGGALHRCGEMGGPCFLHIHTHVREDALILYGFPSREERICFETLIGAHGVGPAVALALLSVHSPTGLRRAVVGEDLDALMLVPGIGKKTAARLVMELRPRFEVEPEAGPELSLVGGSAPARPGDPGAEARADVRAALAGLGYSAEEVRQTIARLPPAGSADELLRHALRELAGIR
jgi:Holliday junction DNA helicase RuvA